MLKPGSRVPAASAPHARPSRSTSMPSPSAAASSNTPVCEGDSLFLMANGGNTYACDWAEWLQFDTAKSHLGTSLRRWQARIWSRSRVATVAMAAQRLPSPPCQPRSRTSTLCKTPAMARIYTFTDVSTGTPTTWAWDFGDGNTSNLQNPTHTYAASGNYARAVDRRQFLWQRHHRTEHRRGRLFGGPGFGILRSSRIPTMAISTWKQAAFRAGKHPWKSRMCMAKSSRLGAPPWTRANCGSPFPSILPPPASILSRSQMPEAVVKVVIR